MIKVCVQQCGLDCALNKCIERGVIITSNKLGYGENIHCFDGGFYYEDGSMIGETDKQTLQFLESRQWTNNAIWYVIGYFEDSDLKELKRIHTSARRYEAAFFEKEYNKLVSSIIYRQIP